MLNIFKKGGWACCPNPEAVSIIHAGHIVVAASEKEVKQDLYLMNLAVRVAPNLKRYCCLWVDAWFHIVHVARQHFLCVHPMLLLQPSPLWAVYEQHEATAMSLAVILWSRLNPHYCESTMSSHDL